MKISALGEDTNENKRIRRRRLMKKAHWEKTPHENMHFRRRHLMNISTLGDT